MGVVEARHWKEEEEDACMCDCIHSLSPSPRLLCQGSKAEG